jgi:hypothetical protein
VTTPRKPNLGDGGMKTLSTLVGTHGQRLDGHDGRLDGHEAALAAHDDRLSALEKASPGDQADGGGDGS